MRKDDLIRGYRILKDFTTAGGGLSKWTFAEKAGKEYFIKEFLFPKYPTDDAPGSPSSKERKRLECEKFEAHHNKVMDQVNAKCGLGGNLVFAIDFFRNGSTYYKVTEKIEIASLNAWEVHKLSLAHRVLILKTIAHSLGILHKAGIVHGDLKPDNVLIKQTKTNLYTTKLIDFDNSYFSGHPPELQEELIGDLAFYSPEMVAFMQGKGAATDLTTASDIFALGLLYGIYLQGYLPEFPQKYQYAGAAVAQGKPLKIADAQLPARLKKLINHMFLADPKARPSIEEVFETLKKIPLNELEEPKPEKEPGKIIVHTSLEGTSDDTKTSEILLKKSGEPKDTERPSLKGKGLKIIEK